MPQPKTCIIEHWFDLVLHQAGLPLFQEFVGKVERQVKVSKPVLSVFFRSNDAYLTTMECSRKTLWKNSDPQIGRQLKIMAESMTL